MSSPQKFVTQPTSTSLWKHQSTKFDDQNYAETVYRTVIGPDGKVKDAFVNAMNELKINSKDIADL